MLLLLSCVVVAYGESPFPDFGGEVALLQDNSLGPVEKVANLLSDMSKTLAKDAENDDELHEKMDCWCITNKKQKTQSNAENAQKSSDLSAEVQSLREKSNLLSEELDHLNNEVTTNQKALDTAVAMRKTEFKEFVNAEKSTADSIEALKGATNALGKILPKSNLQTDMTLDEKSGIVKALVRSMRGRHDILWAIHNDKERKILADLMAHSRDIGFIQEGEQSLTINAPYDIIHGTIQSLGDAFSANLAKLQQDEEDATAQHEALKKTKKMEISAGVASIDSKTQDLANTDERAADARKELDDTNEVLEADTAYLQQVVEQCAMHDKEYAERKTIRRDELLAISQAQMILTSDDARDTFTRTFGHTKRGEKLGSRLLKEHKEERETETMRSQTNAARKKQWGTAERYLLLQAGSQALPQQVSQYMASLKIRQDAGNARYEQDTKDSARYEKMLKIRQDTSKKGETEKAKNATSKKVQKKSKAALTGVKAQVKASGQSSDEASRLANVAQRTEHFWAAKYYMESQEAKKQYKKPKAKGAVSSKSQSQAQHVKVGLTASQVRLRGNAMADAATGVTKMKENLQLQQGEESARKNWCQDEIIATEKALDNTNRKKLDQEENIQLIKERIARLQYEIKQLRYDQQDADIEFAKVSIDRKEECTAYQKTVLDQDTTKKLLGMAQGVLQKFYKKKRASLIRQKVRVDQKFDAQKSMKAMRVIAGSLYGGSDDTLSFDAARKQELSGYGEMAMVQSQNGNAPPPPGFKSYKNNAAKGGLIVMIEGLIEDADAMTKEAAKDETGSMENYEAYVAEANKITRKRQEAIINRQLEVGKLEEFKLEEMIRLNETIATKAHLRQTDIDLHGIEGCDYLLANYATRFVERKEEIDQLSQAEAILGKGGGDAELTAAGRADGDSLAKKAEEGKGAGDSDFTPVEGGVLVHSDAHVSADVPGEEAISKMSG